VNEKETKAKISIYERKLADILEIQISNEVRYKEIKEKGIRLENKVSCLFERAELGEISSSQAELAKQELNELKGTLKKIAILLKGLKQEESQYIEKMYPAETNN
jgi:ribosomal protein L10